MMSNNNLKRILQINSVVNTESTGRIVEELGQVAISQGWESFIAFGRKARPSKSYIIKIGNDLSIKWHGLQTRLFDNHSLGNSSRSATTDFINKIELIKPDIVQLHNLHGYYINIDILFNYLSKSNIPTVWSLHDCWSFTGHCCHFDLINCEKWKIHCHNCPQFRSYPTSYIMDNSYKNFIEKKILANSFNNLTIVSASNWLASKIKESFLSKFELRVIPNGVDLNTFYPRKKTEVIRNKYGFDNKFIILGVASIWSKEKGFYDYLTLSKIIPSNYLIVLLGVTSAQINILPKNIIGLQKTESTEELAELYSTANVVMSLSYLEAFGLTPIEGFACGTPSIVYNRTATPELVNEDTGFIVEPGDMISILKALEIIRTKPHNFYTNSCRKRAEELFDKNKNYLEYLNLYDSLLSKQINIKK